MTDIKKRARRTVSIVLIVSMIFTTACFASYAAGSKKSAAKDKDGETLSTLVSGVNSSGKDETVYVIAGADGSAKQVIVSDWLKNSSKEEAIRDNSILEDVETVKGDAQYKMNKDNMMVWDAEGEDVYYQGTTDKTLPVDLGISYTLNGKSITAKKLAGKSGKVTMRIDYRNNEARTVSINGKSETMYVPFVMLSGMMLDNKNFSNVTVTNGKVVNDGDKSIVMGFALPGMQENLGVAKSDIDIPSYVEVTADVKDFELETTMHFASNDIFNEFNPGEFGSVDDLMAQLNSFVDAANQLQDGSSALYSGLSTLLEKSGLLVEGVNQLYNGSALLKDGTNQFAQGGQQLAAGISQLNEGLKTLTANSGALNAGGEEVFNSLLAMADGQLEQAGLTDVPKLTIGNYNTVLNGVLESLKPENIRQTATETARKQVTETVNGMSSEIRDAVTLKVRDQVLEGVLKAAGIHMTADQYNKAVAAGLIPEAIAGKINAALEQQMASAEIQAKIDQLTQQTIDSKIEEAMNSAEVQKQIDAAVEKASAGSKSIEALIAQLDKYNTFYTGLLAYTAGVDQLYAGSTQLMAGASALVSKTGDLAKGAANLNDGLGTLKSSSGTLIDGVKQLTDGSMTFSDGMKKFNEEGVKKIASVFDGDLGSLSARLQALSDVSKSYDNFAGKADGTKSEVKFMYRTEGIKVTKEK